ncbi:phosphohistidine phosphatase SixA [Pseudomonas sp. HMWF032]|uniref:phosphohistidine phosphatase SixA n=1 Tax=unclassified Pseudomonas TaxID=196821 RepID=UPI000D388D84|nr:MULTISPECIES: phosphohistidine phosphatase SixA [unclassified Pseudomonas]PTS86906.1 phosphohistidine phosphatase SixA [Pseudomonas sp. HMWF032]PTT81653.1 phosphohistidine phosphatase SixA [Pseudomonas sp. HMWF010]WAC44572.1 phosphohistidine phosphatase SixA [Pseudomonas sp. SL4(2022)]
MKLWLLRHGEAEPQARSDAERNLTAYGRQQVREAANYMLGQPLQAVLVSPYVRAQQTADLFCEALGFSGLRATVPWLTPESDLRQALRELGGVVLDELLLVTHQPLVGSLAGLLIHGHRQQPLPMNTASLALLEGDELLAGLMKLSLHKHPAYR